MRRPRPRRASGTAVLDDFLECDILVLGTPIYDFTVPSQLEIWFDRIAIAVRRSDTARPPSRLDGGEARAPRFDQRQYNDNGSPYAERTMLGFVGLSDVQLVRAERLAISPAHRAEAIAAAQASIAALVV